jgi:hypothetical protein
MSFLKKLTVLTLLLGTAAVHAATSSTPQRFTNDTAGDFEPTIFYGRDAAGAIGTTTVSIKYFSTTSFKNSFVSKVGMTTTSGYLPVPPDRPSSYDPYLYANLWASAIAPYRLYCVGLTADVTQGATTNAVTVWRSDNLGADQFTTLPYRIVEAGGTNLAIPGNTTQYENRTLDKPTIVVNGYSSDRGTVYVAYMRQSRIYNKSTGSLATTYESIYAARSTDGGNSWETPVLIYSNQNEPVRTLINSAHIVSANGTGYLYVAWARYSLDPARGGITLARSPGSGTLTGAWAIDTTGPAGPMTSGTKSNDMTQQSVVIMRHNAIANKLMLVWNEPETTTSTSTQDVYYAEKGGNGWTLWNGQKKLKVSSDVSCGTTGTDQVHPTLDYDSTGKITIAYYDRQQSCTNDPYNVYFTQLTTGSTTPAVLVQAPTPFTDLAGSQSSDLTNNQGRIGEYFDLWCYSTTCYTAWIGTPQNSSGTPQGDLLVTTIQ